MKYMTDLERQQQRQKLARVANHHAVADTWQLLFHCILNWNWSDILTSRRYQQFCNNVP